MNKILIIFLLLTSFKLIAKPSSDYSSGIFSGRVSKINTDASLLRVKVTFSNLKYVNKKDKIEFWDERSSQLRCKSYVVGKSNEYLLLKVPDLKYCMSQLFVAPAVHLFFFSQDLVNNLKMGKELVGILLKKRWAIHGMLTRRKIELDAHIEKVNAINMRYDNLRAKLEAEWRGQVNDLEEDKVTTLRNYKSLESNLMDIDGKLEKYRIVDENLVIDRWALDPRLYYKK